MFDYFNTLSRDGKDKSKRKERSGLDWLTQGELKADWLVPNFPVNHGGFKQGPEQQEGLSVCVQLHTLT